MDAFFLIFSDINNYYNKETSMKKDLKKVLVLGSGGTQDRPGRRV